MLSLLLLCALSMYVDGHGYMELPAARNSMWRFGFPNPKDYNDNQLYCGGMTRQIKNHGMTTVVALRPRKVDSLLSVTRAHWI